MRRAADLRSLVVLLVAERLWMARESKKCPPGSEPLNPPGWLPEDVLPPGEPVPDDDLPPGEEEPPPEQEFPPHEGDELTEGTSDRSWDTDQIIEDVVLSTDLLTDTAKEEDSVVEDVVEAAPPVPDLVNESGLDISREQDFLIEDVVFAPVPHVPEILERGFTDVTAESDQVSEQVIEGPPEDPNLPPPPPSGFWNRTLQNQTYQGDLVVPAGERWLIGAGVRLQGNLRTDAGTIGMRPGSSLEFIGADPNAYVGGGTGYASEYAQDFGIWIGLDGVLDISGTPKVSWNRSGVDPTWLSTDQLWVSPTASGDTTPRRWFPGDAIPLDSNSVKAEVMNLTRDVVIKGPAHIHIHSNKAQRIEYCLLEAMGITTVAAGGPVAARAGLFLEQTSAVGTLIRGVAAINCGRVFVPHLSHGLTYTDCVVLNSDSEGFWWKEGDSTNNLTVDRCCVVGRRVIPNISRVTPGLALNDGANLLCQNSVVRGFGPAVGGGSGATGDSTERLQFNNLTIGAVPGQPKVRISATAAKPWRAHLLNIYLIPSEVTFSGGNEESEVIINHNDGRKWRVLYRGGTRRVFGFAELPRVTVDTTMPSVTGTTHNVPNGGDLQAALNAAQYGDIILLAQSATFVGNFVLPAKSGSGKIIVRTNVASPAEGTRVTPASAAANNFAKIKTNNSQPAIATAAGAKGWRFALTEVLVDAAVPEVFSLITLGDGSVSVAANAVRGVVFDRCYIHGHSTLDIQRAFAINCAEGAVIDSYISEIHYDGQDSQAVAGWNGPGPFKLVNNYLEAAGENILWGGADSESPEMIPSDIEIRGNTVIKPSAWFSSQDWTVKNLLELKTARRVLIEENIFDGCWVDGQTGHAFMMFSVNQEGGAPWGLVADVTVRKNTIRNAAAGFTLTARYTQEEPEKHVDTPMSRVIIEDNTFENMALESPYTAVNEARYLVGFFQNLQDVHFRHNAYEDVGLANQVMMETVLGSDGPMAGLWFENNIIGPAEYGFQNANLLASYAPGSIVKGNIMAPDMHDFNDPLEAENCIAWPPPQAGCPNAGVRP